MDPIFKNEGPKDEYGISKLLNSTISHTIEQDNFIYCPNCSKILSTRDTICRCLKLRGKHEESLQRSKKNTFFLKLKSQFDFLLRSPVKQNLSLKPALDYQGKFFMNC